MDATCPKQKSEALRAQYLFKPKMYRPVKEARSGEDPGDEAELEEETAYLVKPPIYAKGGNGNAPSKGGSGNGNGKGKPADKGNGRTGEKSGKCKVRKHEEILSLWEEYEEEPAYLLEPTSRVVYTYDAVGNRLSMTTDQGTIRYTYDKANRMLSAGDTVYQYDAAGNLIAKVKGEAVTTYTYNATGKLVQVTLTDESSVTYAYDALGRKVERTETGWSPLYSPIQRAESRHCLPARAGRNLLVQAASRTYPAACRSCQSTPGRLRDPGPRETPPRRVAFPGSYHTSKAAGV